MLDAYAATPADVVALAPMWWALGPDERGTVYAERGCEDAARREGLWPLALGTPVRTLDRPLLVTDTADRQFVAGRPLVVLDGSFSLAPVPDDGHLYLSASPRAGAEVVGVQSLDWWYRASREDRHPHDLVGVGLILGDLDLRVPEHATILDGWVGALQALASAARSRDWHIVVHGAPSVARQVHARAREVGAGVTYCDRRGFVLQIAHVLASDDRRALVPFAALAGPTVALCDPWRPDPADDDLAVKARHPGLLVESVAMALGENAGRAWKRQRAADRSYPHRDGHAAGRAVDAIRRYGLLP